jgi:hypothetical protein
MLGDQSLRFLASLLASTLPQHAIAAVGGFSLVGGVILLIGSLGMSLHDLVLICRGQRSRTGLASRAWRGLSRAFERTEPPAAERLEPTLELPPRAMAVAGQHPFPSAGFGYEPYPEPLDHPWTRPPERQGPRQSPREPVPPRGRTAETTTRRPRHGILRERDAEQPRDPPPATDERAMAKRFAPERSEPVGRFGFGLFRRRGTAAADQPGAAGKPRTATQRPIWPGSVPVPADEEMPAAEPEVRPVGDELYGRAVALVRAQRKASAQYLQLSLGIGYMRAADLIERMEREGVVGPPVHNGIRPILTPPPGTRIV